MVKRNFKKYKIGIIGIGFVGGALKRYFESMGLKPLFYDKYKKINLPGEMNKTDIIFIAVPTPYNFKTGSDLSAVKEAVGIIKDKKIIVIKSTLIPGTTERLQKKYPQHKILFNPEFLREVSAYKDFIHPDRQILGITKKSKNVAKNIINLLPKAPYQEIMRAREAEMVKYMANSFLSMKVIFANEFYDLCQKLGIDYDKVKEGVAKDLRIGESHLEVFYENYRGYGGSCFPQDVNAIIHFASSKKVNMQLLKRTRQVNRKLLKQSGLSENYFLKFLHRKKNEKKI